ncbi:hypothetical protein ACH5RR_030283, partial [Cinchona calisaya]
YEFWSIKIKTLFKSQDLWDLVENGYPDTDEESKLKENKKKDSRALFFIQQAVHELVFSKVAASTIANEAWTRLKMAFQDNGCSNHITGIKSLLKELDESYKVKVRLGDDKQMQDASKGTVAINNGCGNIWQVKLEGIQFGIPVENKALLVNEQQLTPLNTPGSSSSTLPGSTSSSSRSKSSSDDETPPRKFK